MSDSKHIEELETKIKMLETRVKHLTNDLELTRKENEASLSKYFDLYSNMEKNVEERTEQLAQLQNVLKMKNEQLEIMVDASPGMIFYKDVNEKYIRLNKGFAETFGGVVQDYIGKTHADMFPSDADSFFASDKIVFEKKIPVLNQTVFVKTSRGERHLLVSKVPYKDMDGNVVGIIGFALDTSDIYRAEQERDALKEKLARSEKMEAIGTLAGGVAHDLNNILTGIVSYPDLVLMELPEDSNLKRPIMSIQEAGLKAASIVQDLLMLARRGLVMPAVFNLNTIIEEYLNSLEHEKLEMYYSNINLNNRLVNKILSVKCSPSHVNKVIGNLLTFMYECMGNGGTVTITTVNKHVDHAFIGYERIPEGDYVVIRVKSDNLELSDENLKRIFEPFYTKKVMGLGGSGLGMAVVWGVVKDHAGYIDASNLGNKETAFDMFFPATHFENQPDTPENKLAKIMGNGELIMVVDDLEKQREIASTILQKLNYRVVSVPSGEEAVAYLKEHAIDLFVLDMIMEPGIDGLETYEQLLQVNPDQKAIITSGYAETERVIKAQQLGAGAYIRKPYLIETLGKAIKKELKKEGPTREI